MRVTAVVLVTLVACGPKPQPQADPCAPGITVGTLSEDLDFRSCAVRTKESAGVNLLTDSVWWALQDDHFSAEVTAKVKAKDVKFFLDNSGGAQFKANVVAGPICSTGYPKRVNDAMDDAKSFHEGVLPFFNSIVLVTLTRDKLRQILERGFAKNLGTGISYPNEDGSFLVPSGNVVITVDFANYDTLSTEVGGAMTRTARPTTREGSLIKSMTVDGQPFAISGSDTVTVAMSSFVAGIAINAADNTINGTPFEGAAAGYATGFISDFITNAKPPAATYEILTSGVAASSEDAITHTSALGKYIAANKTLNPAVTGRYVYQNVTALSAQQQAKLANPCQ